MMNSSEICLNNIKDIIFKEGQKARILRLNTWMGYHVYTEIDVEYDNKSISLTDDDNYTHSIRNIAENIKNYSGETILYASNGNSKELNDILDMDEILEHEELNKADIDQIATLIKDSFDFNCRISLGAKQDPDSDNTLVQIHDFALSICSNRPVNNKCNWQVGHGKYTRGSQPTFLPERLQEYTLTSDHVNCLNYIKRICEENYINERQIGHKLILNEDFSLLAGLPFRSSETYSNCLQFAIILKFNPRRLLDKLIRLTQEAIDYSVEQARILLSHGDLDNAETMVNRAETLSNRRGQVVEQARLGGSKSIIKELTGFKKRNKERRNKIRQNKTRQNKTRRNKTRQNKTRQNKTRRNKTKRNKTNR